MSRDLTNAELQRVDLIARCYSIGDVQNVDIDADDRLRVTFRDNARSLCTGTLTGFVWIDEMPGWIEFDPETGRHAFSDVHDRDKR